MPTYGEGERKVCVYFFLYLNISTFIL